MKQIESLFLKWKRNIDTAIKNEQEDITCLPYGIRINNDNTFSIIDDTIYTSKTRYKSLKELYEKEISNTDI